MQEIFKKFDMDGNGYITEKEMHQALANHGMKPTE